MIFFLLRFKNYSLSIKIIYYGFILVGSDFWLTL